MCGIFCSFSQNSEAVELCDKCESLIRNRGPDAYNNITVESEQFTFKFAASVLWLQGKELTKQPVISGDSVFVYNGDIFNRDYQESLTGDTRLLLKAIENSESVINVLQSLHGPYAFVYFDRRSSKLYFTRDIFGRRSLVISKKGNGILLSSVMCKNEGSSIELPAIGLFMYDLINKQYTLYPWKAKNRNFSLKLNEVEAFLQSKVNVIDSSYIPSLQFRDPIDNDLNILNSIKQLDIAEAFKVLLNDSNWFNNVKKLNDLLLEAIRKRIATQPQFCKNCITAKIECHHCRIGILFSGGLDCSILAVLTDKIIPQDCPIDLMNVAFDKVQDYKTPDRLTGLESFEELQLLCPNRKWNFLDINIAGIELENLRQNHIRHLIHPLNTILDDSLGCALWFAARGQCESYTSPCRVLLVGMGADELFGGYTRHRAALKRSGWIGLFDSLNEDWQNISHRNLARDDRVVSDHGRQLRTPYLDENVVDFVRGLNPWEKTFPSNEVAEGLGEKIILRSLAFHLGLRGAASFKKRALQFGCRIANKKENAHEISPRL